MEDLEKKYEALDFTNDLIFKYVLSSDIELCKDFIHRIDPEADTEGIHYVETEHEIVVGVKDEKRVRFDVMTRTELTRADLEMIAHYPIDGLKNFPKIGRYNAAMIDTDLMKNHSPADLPDVSVILLCTFDPLGFEEPVYRARTKVDGHNDYEYNEGRRIFILTNKGIDKAPEPLKPIIHLLSKDKEPMDDPLYRKVQASVKEIKKDKSVRRAAMNLLQRDEAIRAEGREEGRKEAMAQERLKAIANMLKLYRETNRAEDEILSELLALYPENEELIKKLMSA